MKRCVLLAVLLNIVAQAWAIPSIQDFHPAPDYPNQTDYLSLLQNFPRYAERLWHDEYRGDPQLGYFGTGGHDHNQMRALTNFIFVYSLLATRAEWDETATGIGQDVLLDRARKALRYFTDTHVTGNKLCTDWRKWGQQPEQWVSPWVISKAVTGASLIWDRLTTTEQKAVQRVVIHEANYLLGHRAMTGDYRSLGGEFRALTAHSEFNSLNAELLSWAASLLPNHYNAERWVAKAQEYFMNAFSVEADKYDTTLVDGKPVNEWVYTTNLHPDFTLEAHGAYQFDYVGCPLHSRAWAYYAFVSNGRKVPEALMHHVPDVWEMAKRTQLYAGRFAYVQGKDWGRHVYGLYFIVPALVLMQNELGYNDARLVEQLRFRAFEWEQQRYFNGGIFAGRFAYQREGWPVIYESDCYANLGLAYLLHQYAPTPPAASLAGFQQEVEGTFHSRYIEALQTRNQDMFASFSWRHLNGRYPIALFVPGDDYIAEWGEGNLIGRVVVDGADMERTTLKHTEHVLEDGFVTTGHIQEARRSFRYGVDHHISFTALPKERMVLLLEQLIAKDTIRTSDNTGLSYDLPNDVFNEDVRTIYSEDGSVRLKSYRGAGHVTTIESKWINVDNKLGFISITDNGYFRIQGGNRHMWYGQICDRIDYVSGPQKKTYKTGDVIQEQAYLLVSGDSAFTRSMAAEAAEWLATDDKRVKAVVLKTDRSSRLITANFNRSAKDTVIHFPDGRELPIQLPALDTMVRDEQGGSEIVHVPDNSAMVLVPAGEFLMGTSDSHFAEVTRGDSYRASIFKHEQPQHEVYLDSYYIDKYEVTNAQFERFVQETGYVTDAEREGWGYIWEGYNHWPRIRGANWRTPLGPGSSIRNRMAHPVVQVSHNDALAYARWAGKRLPTEAEWEKAARGTDGWKYPWGNRADVTRLNSADRGPGTTTPVGTFPKGASPYGMQDALGNVWEWVADWFDFHYYTSQQEWVNPTGPSRGIHRVLKGGCWLNKLAGMRTSFRDNHVSVPSFRVQLGGFRCAKSAIPFDIEGQVLLPEDINSDGVVDVLDLVLVGSEYGRVPPTNPGADVNHDGVVGLSDLIRIASSLGKTGPAAAPSQSVTDIRRDSPQEIAALEQALAELEAIPNPSNDIEVAIQSLRSWLQNSALVPLGTELLPNYPNPFNPETWIPYALHEAADVQIRIYSEAGHLVRTLDLGNRTPGIYASQTQAAYWDGKNNAGEAVSSGIYFYELDTGNTKLLRKAMLLK